MSNSPTAASTAAVQISVLTVKECFIFKVPPLKSASGHRAEDWDIDKPLMTGHLKVFQTDDKLKIVLYRYKDPASTSTVDNLIIFAECPISVKPKEDITPFVDAVIDSSRYYVLRIKDPTHPTRSAIIGIGFRERDTALDFKHVLNEYVRYVDRMAQAEELAAQYVEGEDGAADVAEGSKPMKDLSIKQGHKIHVNVPHRAVGSTDGRQMGSAAAADKTSGSGRLLKPPPPPPGALPEVRVGVLGQKASRTNDEPPAMEEAGGEDEEWGDFA